jgi:hypothetical protein
MPLYLAAILIIGFTVNFAYFFGEIFGPVPILASAILGVAMTALAVVLTPLFEDARRR